MKVVFLSVALSVLFWCHPARGQNPPDPRLLDPVAGILAAFRTHDLVALGEMHGLQEEADFVLTLLRHPRTAGVINDIVEDMRDISTPTAGTNHLTVSGRGCASRWRPLAGPSVG
ncbi:MAG: hypothetical protein ABI542_09975 [Gemmatimonadota bacterium]